MRIVVRAQERALNLTRGQFDYLHDLLTDELQEFLKGNEPIWGGMEREPTPIDLEVLALYKMLKLVSSDATLDDSGYLVGESEAKDRVREITRALKGEGR